MDVKIFARKTPLGIDFLQAYTHPKSHQLIYIVDELSQTMKEKCQYSSEELKTHNYFTLMLKEEYSI